MKIIFFNLKVNAKRPKFQNINVKLGWFECNFKGKYCIFIVKICKGPYQDRGFLADLVLFSFEFNY